jgi:hypothetical protein
MLLARSTEGETQQDKGDDDCATKKGEREERPNNLRQRAGKSRDPARGERQQEDDTTHQLDDLLRVVGGSITTTSGHQSWPTPRMRT